MILPYYYLGTKQSAKILGTLFLLFGAGVIRESHTKRRFCHE